MSNARDENNAVFKIVAIFGSIAVCYIQHRATIPILTMICYYLVTFLNNQTLDISKSEHEYPQ